MRVFTVFYNTFMFDKPGQEWKPRYGYKRGNDETQDWLLEVPQNAGTFHGHRICMRYSLHPMCGFRKCPYSLHGRFFVLHPLFPQEITVYFRTLLLKI